MNRCPSPNLRRHGMAAALALALLPATLLAQSATPRQFPAHALRGTLVVTQPPLITLDGQPAQLSPGSRIKGTNNLLVMSASLVGQSLTVNYTTEQHGLVHEVWILTDAEAAEKRKRAGE